LILRQSVFLLINVLTYGDVTTCEKMTYDNIDSNSDGVIDAPVDNDSVSTDHSQPDRVATHTYQASEFATAGSGTLQDPYMDGIQAAFDQAAADGVEIAKIDVSGVFDLANAGTVTPPSIQHFEVVGTGNFNYIYAPAGEPAFLINNLTRSPYFRGFRANGEGQAPFIRFDMGGMQTYGEGWFDRVEWDQVWRAVEIDTSDASAGLFSFSNNWFHTGDPNTNGDYYIRQIGSNDINDIRVENSRFWHDASETADGFQGGLRVDNGANRIVWQGNVHNNAGQGELVRFDGGGLLATDNRVALDRSEADATGAMFHGETTSYLKVSDNQFSAGFADKMVQVDSANHVNITDNANNGNWATQAVDIAEGNISALEDSIVEGNTYPVYFGFIPNFADTTNSRITPSNGDSGVLTSGDYFEVTQSPVTIHIDDDGSVDNIYVQDKTGTDGSFVDMTATPFMMELRPPMRIRVDYSTAPSMAAFYSA